MKAAFPDGALIMVAMAIVVCSPVLTLLMQKPAQAGGIALVIASPWGDAAQIAEKAGVQEVTPERAPLGVLVLLENSQNVSQLYAQGAWLVIDGEGVLDLCAL